MFGQQLAVVFPLQQHIFRFDVTMRQAMLMKVPQTTEDAVEDSGWGVTAQRSHVVPSPSVPAVSGEHCKNRLSVPWKSVPHEQVPL